MRDTPGADNFDITAIRTQASVAHAHDLARPGPDRTPELQLAFTYADAVASTWVSADTSRDWPGGLERQQIELAKWLAASPDAARSELPFIWVIDDDGELARAIVSRELAFACRERLRVWRRVQELRRARTSTRAAHLAARRQALAEGEAERRALELKHAQGSSSCATQASPMPWISSPAPCSIQTRSRVFPHPRRARRARPPPAPALRTVGTGAAPAAPARRRRRSVVR
jgi:hypothetical protein